METPCMLKPAVQWADLATLDLSLFDTPGGKQKLATQLFQAIDKIGKEELSQLHQLPIPQA